MIFEALFDSAQAGELILIDGGMCRYHRRKDGQLTIREIISLRPGAGKEMLSMLISVPDVKSIYARCPADLESNAWYSRRGFSLESTISTKSGRVINCWRLSQH